MVRTLGQLLPLAEASLDASHIVSQTLNQLGIPHKYESGGKHMHAVYKVGDREHRFPVSHGKRWDGPIRHQIASAVRRHVRAAQQLVSK